MYFSSAMNQTILIHFPVSMRIPPAVSISNVSHFLVTDAAAAGKALTDLTINPGTTEECASLNCTVASGLVAGNSTLLASSSTSATLVLNAEL